MVGFFVDKIMQEDISEKPGCYFIYANSEDVVFVNETTAKENYTKKVKGKTILITQLCDATELQELFNLNSSSTLYIGKATSLKKRLKQLYDTAQGNSINHHGGCHLWQIKNWENILKVQYIECKTKEEASGLEYFLINEFMRNHNNRKPVANIRNGKKCINFQSPIVNEKKQIINLFCK